MLLHPTSNTQTVSYHVMSSMILAHVWLVQWSVSSVLWLTDKSVLHTCGAVTGPAPASRRVACGSASGRLADCQSVGSTGPCWSGRSVIIIVSSTNCHPPSPSPTPSLISCNNRLLLILVQWSQLITNNIKDNYKNWTKKTILQLKSPQKE